MIEYLVISVTANERFIYHVIILFKKFLVWNFMQFLAEKCKTRIELLYESVDIFYSHEDFIHFF